MEVRFLGGNCFQLRSKKVAIVTDPYFPSSDRMPKIAADIVTFSHHIASEGNIVEGTSRRIQPFIIDGPGEYEVSNVSIFGFSSKSKNKRNTIYVMTIEKLKMVHLGHLSGLLNDNQLEQINGAQIVFLPIGGGDVFNVQQAVAQLSHIQAKIVIPMHFGTLRPMGQQAPVVDFLKQLGETDVKPAEKLVITYDKLPEERITVVLNAKH